MVSKATTLAGAMLLCLALAGCAGGPSTSPEPEITTEPTTETTPEATPDTTPEPAEATSEPSETEGPTMQPDFDFGDGAHVTFPENLVYNSILSERIDFTDAIPATMDTYWLKDSSSTLRVALARVYSDAQLYTDPNAPETRDAVIECLKASVFPMFTDVLSDVTFIPAFAQAEITQGTYPTDAGELPMLEIQTQDAYRLRAVIAPRELIVLLGFSEAEKQPVMDYLDSLTIKKN